MGTVGINFGSATSGQGFDVATTVSQITASMQAVETPWNNQLTSLKAQDTALSSIGTDLSSLSTALQSLTDFEGVLASKSGSSSDPDALALTNATSTATAGSHSITVSQLSQTSSDYSDPISSTDTLSGSLTIQVGSGTAQTINIVSGTSDTLSTLAAAINAADIGVTAGVVSDASGSRLSLVSNTPGAGGQLTITPSITDTTTGSAININTGLTGQDALLTVDGVHIDSASNNVSTAIPGVTFQLLTTTTSPVQVQIVNDNSTVESAFSSFVSAYNTVVGDLSTQEGNDSSGNPEPLYGNPIISQMQTDLSLALSAGSPSGSVSNLDQLGLTVNDDGTLSLDTSTLDGMLNTNYTDVVGFMQNTDSFGQKLTAALNQLGTGASGAVTLTLASNATQESTLNDDITNQNAYIATQTAQLTAQLNTANEVLQSIPSQLTEINELYDSIIGYNPNSTS